MSPRSGEGDASIVSVGADDLAAVVRLHQRVFPDSVLTRLGPEALERYYAWQLLGPHDVVAIGVASSGRLLGLLVGGRFRGTVAGFVKQDPTFLARRVLRHPSVVVHPAGRRAVRTGLRLLVRPAGAGQVERPERVPDGSFGVLVVAVDPDAQRTGFGRVLLEEAERRARELGFERMHLTLDPTNWGALAFYRELGWQRLGLPGDTDRAWLVGKELGEPPSSVPPVALR